MAERNSWAVSGGVQTTEDGRLALAALLTPGAAAFAAKTGFRPTPGTPGKVTASSTPDGSVHVAPFQAFLQSSRSSAPGSYIMTLDAVKNINVFATAPDPSNPRNDLIIAQQSDLYYGDGSSVMTVKVVAGTPSGTPADPAVTGSADYITLARVRVRANASSVLTTDITDLRPAGLYTVAVGGLLPVPTQAARDALTGVYDGFAIWRQDRHWVEIYDGTQWRLHGQAVAASTGRPLGVAGDRLYESDTGFTYLNNGSKWLRNEVTIVKSADEQRLNTTTLAAVSEIVIAAEANSVYQFDYCLFVFGDSNVDMRVGMTWPAGATGRWTAMPMQTGAVSSTDTTTWHSNTTLQDPSWTAGLIGGSDTTMYVRGTVHTAGTAGTAGFRFAQATINAGLASWVRADSWIKYRQVA